MVHKNARYLALFLGLIIICALGLALKNYFRDSFVVKRVLSVTNEHTYGVTFFDRWRIDKNLVERHIEHWKFLENSVSNKGGSD